MAQRTGRLTVTMGALVTGLALLVPPAKGQAGTAAQNGTQPQTGAQTPEQAGAGNGERRRGQYAGIGRVMGEVSAVNGATVTVKAEDGSTVQVVTTENTRVMKDRNTVKVADLHPGDGLMAMGNLDGATKTLHAAFVVAEDAAQVKAMKENLGKTYITGRVTAIDLDNAKMTVERPDHQSQVIAFDESTSFKRAVRGGGGNGGAGGSGNGGEGTGSAGPGAGRGPGSNGGGFGGGAMGMGGMGMMSGGMDRAFNNGESITLADIKVGDFVSGTGSVKNGTFVPVHLLDAPPGQRRQRTGDATTGAGTAAGSGTVPPGPGGR